MHTHSIQCMHCGKYLGDSNSERKDNRQSILPFWLPAVDPKKREEDRKKKKKRGTRGREEKKKEKKKGKNSGKSIKKAHLAS